MCYCPTPTLHLNLALTGDCAFLLSPKKPHSVWFISVLNYGDIGSVLIKHLQIVIPLSYPCHYTNLCPHKPHKPAHTHTHTQNPHNLTDVMEICVTRSHTYVCDRHRLCTDKGSEGSIVTLLLPLSPAELNWLEWVILSESEFRDQCCQTLPQKISRTTLKSLHFSQKVAKYEKKVNTGKFGKGKYIYIYTLQMMTV